MSNSLSSSVGFVFAVSERKEKFFYPTHDKTDTEVQCAFPVIQLA